jgi:hypothetical protein
VDHVIENLRRGLVLSLYTRRTACAVRFSSVRMRGSCGRQWSCAPNSGALWLAMVPAPLCSRRLPYETAPAESNQGTAMIEDAPGSRIFGFCRRRHAGRILTGTLDLRIATSTRSEVGRLCEMVSGAVPAGIGTGGSK